MSRVEQFLPFDSLKGFRDELKKAERMKLKIDKPVLSDDQIEELNYIIREVYENKEEVNILYYQKGYLVSSTGFILKITEGTLHTSNQRRISLDSVCFIEKKNDS